MILTYQTVIAEYLNHFFPLQPIVLFSKLMHCSFESNGTVCNSCLLKMFRALFIALKTMCSVS